MWENEAPFCGKVAFEMLRASGCAAGVWKGSRDLKQTSTRRAANFLTGFGNVQVFLADGED